MLDNTINQPTKFRTKKWIEIDDDSGGTYNTNSQIKFKTSMLNSSLCDAYILVKGTITMALVSPPAANPNNNDKEVVFKNSAPFTDCIIEINNTQTDNAKYEINSTQTDNAKYIDVIMPMYNLIKYSDNYSKTS